MSTLCTELDKIEKERNYYKSNFLDLIERLKQIDERGLMPEQIIDSLSKQFVELEDKDPFIYCNGLFMINKEGNPHIYQLQESKNSHNHLVIQNISIRKVWKGSIIPSNTSEIITLKDAYLTKSDFAKLLGNSGCKVSSVSLLTISKLDEVRGELFS